MNLSPILLFVYNRPDHTEKTLEALFLNELASESELFVFSDGPKKDATNSEKEEVEKVRKIIRKKKWAKTVSIIENDVNIGLAISIINGVSVVLKKYNKVIVLEDDIITSPFFLNYMNDALILYESKSQVACISGYIFPLEFNLPDTFFIKGADCWGWGTWQRSWNDFEKDGAKLLAEIYKRDLSYEFDFYGTHNYTKMLQDQVFGRNNSWAIRWYASAFLKNKLCLYPGFSLVQNIGFDGSGVHSGNSKKWDVNLYNSKIIVELIDLEESVIVKRQIAKYFSNSIKNDSFFKKIIGRISKLMFSKKKHGWFGNYKTWNSAKAKSSGYDSIIILEKVKKAILQVKNREAIYERDSVLFDEIHYSIPLLNAFKSIAIENNQVLNVIDFGGSLGSSYYQNRDFLNDLKEINWNVVEQKHFVECGQQYIEEEQLKFFYSIEDAIFSNCTDLLLLSGVIQYMEEPYEFIKKCINYNFQYIIVDRTAFIKSSKDRITIQIVPETIYKASYPAWFFNEQKFVNAFLENYKLVNEFDCIFDPQEKLGRKWTYRKGFVFKRL